MYNNAAIYETQCSENLIIDHGHWLYRIFYKQKRKGKLFVLPFVCNFSNFHLHSKILQKSMKFAQNMANMLEVAQICTLALKWSKYAFVYENVSMKSGL